jgi:hypothetical protein
VEGVLVDDSSIVDIIYRCRAARPITQSRN